MTPPCRLKACRRVSVRVFHDESVLPPIPETLDTLKGPRSGAIVNHPTVSLGGARLTLSALDACLIVAAGVRPRISLTASTSGVERW